MRYARIGFHLVMILLLVLAFSGVLSPRPSGSFIAASGNTVSIIIGVLFIWLVGAVVFRFVGRVPRG